MSQQYVQKYVIVHFLDIHKIPTDFSASKWPLHITLLANFQVRDIESFKHKLEEYSKRITAFTVRVNGEALFGPHQNVKVSLIKPDETIFAMHNNLLSIANKKGAIFDEPGFAGTGYRPHATIQSNNKLQGQEDVRINSFTLVDIFPSHDHMQRRLIETYSLSG